MILKSALGNAEGPSRDARIRSAEANSGQAFVRSVGLKLDPINAPNLRLFSWNVGRQPVTTDKSSSALVDILSQTDMKALSSIYFEKFHPLYGFLDREEVLERLDARWSEPAKVVPYDAVLCGVAALGYLFSHRRATIEEGLLAESARSIIEQNSANGPPLVDIVIALVLRVAYLRLTDKPYVAWMASCSLMHMIEETGLHLESSTQTVLTKPYTCNPDIRRRLYGLSQHLHVWMAFDLGRSRVKLLGSSNVPLSPRTGDYLPEILSLLPFSESLDPEQSKDPIDLGMTMSKVLKNVYIHPASVTAQCNLVLCIYRRLRTLKCGIASNCLKNMFLLIEKTLEASRELLAACCPWFAISNLPFQIICSLLAIDTPEAISHLDDAMTTLKEVASVYDTDRMKEAYRVACVLVMMYYQKKERDLSAIRRIAQGHCSPTIFREPTAEANKDSCEPSWLEGLNLLPDVPGISAVDLEELLFPEMAWGA